MSKIRVYQDDHNKYPDYFLRLIETEEGVKLIICNSTGQRVPAGSVLQINETGLTRYPHVNSCAAGALGLPLDAEGKISE